MSIKIGKEFDPLDATVVADEVNGVVAEDLAGIDFQTELDLPPIDDDDDDDNYFVPPEQLPTIGDEWENLSEEHPEEGDEWGFSDPDDGDSM
jgi:hypothetical protein